MNVLTKIVYILEIFFKGNYMFMKHNFSFQSEYLLFDNTSFIQIQALLDVCHVPF